MTKLTVLVAATLFAGSVFALPVDFYGREVDLKLPRGFEDAVMYIRGFEEPIYQRSFIEEGEMLMKREEIEDLEARSSLFSSLAGLAVKGTKAAGQKRLKSEAHEVVNHSTNNGGQDNPSHGQCHHAAKKGIQLSGC